LRRKSLSRFCRDRQIPWRQRNGLRPYRLQSDLAPWCSSVHDCRFVWPSPDQAGYHSRCAARRIRHQRRRAYLEGRPRHEGVTLRAGAGLNFVMVAIPPTAIAFSAVALGTYV